MAYATSGSTTSNTVYVKWKFGPVTGLKTLNRRRFWCCNGCGKSGPRDSSHHLNLSSYCGEYEYENEQLQKDLLDG